MQLQRTAQSSGARGESTYRTGPNLPKRSKSSSGVTLKLQEGQRGRAGGGAHYLKFLTKRALQDTGQRRRRAGSRAVAGMRRRRTYRLTSGASLPPLLILWRRGRTGGSGFWMAIRRAGGLEGERCRRCFHDAVGAWRRVTCPAAAATDGGRGRPGRARWPQAPTGALVERAARAAEGEQPRLSSTAAPPAPRLLLSRPGSRARCRLRRGPPASRARPPSAARPACLRRRAPAPPLDCHCIPPPRDELHHARRPPPAARPPRCCLARLRCRPGHARARRRPAPAPRCGPIARPEPGLLPAPSRCSASRPSRRSTARPRRALPRRRRPPTSRCRRCCRPRSPRPHCPRATPGSRLLAASPVALPRPRPPPASLSAHTCRSLCHARCLRARTWPPRPPTSPRPPASAPPSTPTRSPSTSARPSAPAPSSMPRPSTASRSRGPPRATSPAGPTASSTWPPAARACTTTPTPSSPAARTASPTPSCCSTSSPSPPTPHSRPPRRPSGGACPRARTPRSRHSRCSSPSLPTQQPCRRPTRFCPARRRLQTSSACPSCRCRLLTWPKADKHKPRPTSHSPWCRRRSLLKRPSPGSTRDGPRASHEALAAIPPAASGSEQHQSPRAHPRETPRGRRVSWNRRRAFQQSSRLLRLQMVPSSRNSLSTTCAIPTSTSAAIHSPPLPHHHSAPPSLLRTSAHSRYHSAPQKPHQRQPTRCANPQKKLPSSSRISYVLPASRPTPRSKSATANNGSAVTAAKSGTTTLARASAASERCGT